MVTAREFVRTHPDPGRALVAVVARRAGYTVADVRGPSRAADLVAVRRAIARALRERGWPWPMIGAALRRHYSTVAKVAMTDGHADAEELGYYTDLARRHAPPPPADVRRVGAPACADCGKGTWVRGRRCQSCAHRRRWAARKRAS